MHAAKEIKYFFLSIREPIGFFNLSAPQPDMAKLLQVGLMRVDFQKKKNGATGEKSSIRCLM
jgi:hypothetical protein